MFYTNKISEFFNYTQDYDIFGKKMRIEDIIHVYFEQIVSFCVIIYSNTNSLQLFCENSSMNSPNST